jgi:hypothetical protein
MGISFVKKMFTPTSSLRAPSSEENIILYIDSTSNFKHSYTYSNHQINLIFHNTCIQYYSRDKLHVGQITVRESARSTK